VWRPPRDRRNIVRTLVLLKTIKTLVGSIGFLLRKKWAEATVACSSSLVTHYALIWIEVLTLCDIVYLLFVSSFCHIYWVKVAGVATLDTNFLATYEKETKFSKIVYQ
jgi:hypothetical protein